MLRTVLIGVLASCLPFLLGYLAIHVSLHPPTTKGMIKLRKWQFAVLALLCALASFWQTVVSYHDQKRTEEALSKTVGNLVANNCISVAQAKQINQEGIQECIERIQALASKWPDFKSRGGTTIPLDTRVERSGNGIHIAKNESGTLPTTALLEAVQLKGMVVKYSDSPACFDKFSIPVYEGCETSDCDTPCITLTSHGVAP